MAPSIQSQILDNVMGLVGGQAALIQRVDNIDTKIKSVEEKLDNHLKECGNNNRPKDDKGEYLERRNGWYRFKKKLPLIAITLSILTFLGGWSACEYADQWIHKLVVDYSEHLKSDQ